MTACESVDELAALSESPEYVAVMVWEPIAKPVVLNVAWPPEIVTAGCWFLPSTLNNTVPVAVLGDTVAVKLSD